jgi:hypothetical protein
MPKPKKKIKKTTIKKRLDKLWSLLIRKVGKCEICGGIQYLNAHHIIGRKALNTRWDINNGCCLCAGCHTLKNRSAHQDPLFFIDWLKRTRPEDFKYLDKKRKETPRPFSSQDYLETERQLKELAF